MTLSLTEEKKDRIKKLASELLVANNCTVRMVARFIGNLTASFEAVPGGRLYYRHIELCKIQALKGCKGDYESLCTLSGRAKVGIKWWIANISNSFSYIKSYPEIDYVIYTDASNSGWGATDLEETINGRWSQQEQDLHINCLEILAIKFAVSSLLHLQSGIKHVRIMSDNATAISYINRQGVCTQWCAMTLQ